MAYSQLTYGDRIRISVLVQQGMSSTQNAQEVDQHRSTIYRELGRNQASEGGYFPDTANIYAIQRKIEATSISRIDENMKASVIEKILLQWSRRFQIE